MTKYSITKGELNQFCGSTIVYEHPLFGYRYTEGIAFLAKDAGAYWLLDAIHSWQCEKSVRDDPMLQEIQFWKLSVRSDKSATLTCRKDDDQVVVAQDIEYTDFPFDAVFIYYIEGMMLLPSEY